MEVVFGEMNRAHIEIGLECQIWEHGCDLEAARTILDRKTHNLI